MSSLRVGSRPGHDSGIGGGVMVVDSAVLVGVAAEGVGRRGGGAPLRGRRLRDHGAGAVRPGCAKHRSTISCQIYVW